MTDEYTESVEQAVEASEVESVDEPVVEAEEPIVETVEEFVVEEPVERPKALGAPGTIVDPTLPKPDDDGFLQAVVNDAEKSKGNYSVIVRDEVDVEAVRNLLVHTTRLATVRRNPTLAVRATWRKAK